MNNMYMYVYEQKWLHLCFVLTICARDRSGRVHNRYRGHDPLLLVGLDCSRQIIINNQRYNASN